MSWQIKLLQFIKPVLRYLGKLYLPYTVKKVTGREYFEIRDIIEPGDIILSSTHGQISNLLNPAEWSHAAIYCGLQKNSVGYVLEAVGRGVVKTDIITHILSKDEIAVIKAKQLSKYKRAKIRSEAIDLYEGTDYDFLFLPGAKALYCYELCVEILRQYCPALDMKMEDKFLGHEYYGYKTFINNTDDFELVFNTRGK